MNDEPDEVIPIEDAPAYMTKLAAERDEAMRKLETANAKIVELNGFLETAERHRQQEAEARIKKGKNFDEMLKIAKDAIRERDVALLQISELREKLREVHNGQGYRDGTGPCDCQWCAEKPYSVVDEVGAITEDQVKRADGILKQVERATEEKITVREACRKRILIGPADAEALEHGLTQLEAENKKLRGMYDAAMSGREPIPMILWCPTCGESHVDKGEWATKLHRTHRCEHCAGEWRPSHRATVGVASLGSKTSPPEKAVDTCPEH